MSAKTVEGDARAEIEVAGKLSFRLAMPAVDMMSHVIYLRSNCGEIWGLCRKGSQATTYRVDVDAGSESFVICTADSATPVYVARLKKKPATMQLYVGVYICPSGHEVRIIE